MAGEMCLIACPGDSSDPAVLVEFCQLKLGLQGKQLQLVTSGDSGPLRAAPQFSQMLALDTIELDYRWDSWHTAETQQASVEIPNLQVVAEFFGPETEDEFNSRIGGGIEVTANLTKVILISSSVADLVSGMCGRESGQVILQVLDDSGSLGIGTTCSMTDFKQFEAAKKPPPPVIKPPAFKPMASKPVPPVAAMPVPPVEAKPEPPAPKTVVEEAKVPSLPAKSLAPRSDSLALDNELAERLKASVVQVVRDSLEASAPGIAPGVLAAVESRIAAEVNNWSKQVSEQYAKEFRLHFDFFRSASAQQDIERDKTYIQFSKIVEEIKTQQKKVHDAIDAVSNALPSREGVINTLDVARMVKRLDAYEKINGLFMQRLIKLKPKEGKKHAIEAKEVQTKEGVRSLVFNSRKLYFIEDVDVYMENTSNSEQMMVASGLKVLPGENTVELAAAGELVGKFNFYLSQRDRRLSENLSVTFEPVVPKPPPPKLSFVMPKIGRGAGVDPPKPAAVAPPKPAEAPEEAKSSVPEPPKAESKAEEVKAPKFSPFKPSAASQEGKTSTFNPFKSSISAAPVAKPASQEVKAPAFSPFKPAAKPGDLKSSAFNPAGAKPEFRPLMKPVFQKPPEERPLAPEQQAKLEGLKEIVGEEAMTPEMVTKITAFLKTEKGARKTRDELVEDFFES